VAIASLGSLGGTSAKASGTTLAVSPSQTLALGDWVVWWVAWESDYFFGPDGLQNGVLKCTDDGGQIYTSLATAYPTGGASSLAAIFLARVRSTFTTSTVVTFTHRSSLIPKAVSGWAFRPSNDATLRWASYAYRTNGVGSIGIDPPSIDQTLLANQENLFLHCLAAEAPSTDSYTWDADYTQIDTFGTTGGAASSNVTVLGGWRIATLTVDTVDVQSDTADRNYDQVLTAVTEVAYSPYLPTAPILDDFNRADEEPLAAPPWQLGGRPGTGAVYMRVASLLGARGLLAAGAGSQWWGTSFSSNDFETYFALDTVGLATAYFHATGDGNNSTLDAYLFGYDLGGQDVSREFVFGDAGNAGGATNGNCLKTWGPAAAPQVVGCQFKSPVLHLWLGANAAWEWQAALYATAPHIRTTGKVGMSMGGDAATRVLYVGAGDAVVPVQNVRLPYLHVGP
jgi:hypothetical protein